MAKRKKSIRRALFSDRDKGVDKVLVFRFFRLLHGRFWGLGALFSILIGSGIGYLIRPDLLGPDIALSELGTDIRTAPFFSGAMFFSAYSLWRWRMYLSRTMKNDKPVIPLVSLTILGAYMIALMPVTWEVWPHRLHNIGVALAGISMSATVLADSLFSRTRRGKNLVYLRLVKLASFMLIIFGGIITTLSLREFDKLQLMLVGEAMMFAGYGIWVILKIYIGEGRQSTIGKIFQKVAG